MTNHRAYWIGLVFACVASLGRGEPGDLVTYKEACELPPSSGKDADPMYDLGHPALPPGQSIQVGDKYITFEQKTPLARYCRYDSVPTEDIGAQNNTATDICNAKWQEREAADKKLGTPQQTLVCPDHRRPVNESTPWFMFRSPGSKPREMIRGTHDHIRDAHVLYCYALCPDPNVENTSGQARALELTLKTLNQATDILQKQVNDLQAKQANLEEQIARAPAPAQ